MRARTAYTNKVPAGTFRGTGKTQTTFGVESTMDSVARQLGLDPIAFRERNLIVDEDVAHYDGTTAVVRTEHLDSADVEFLRWRDERWIKLRHFPSGESMRFWHNDIGLSWGGSIIGLTVVIRLLILPLTFKQVRSMQALQRLQPEMKKIQERFKDDKQRQQQEMMEFYREHQVNPLGSCLPLILQIPFFIGLYQTLRSPGFKAEVGDAGQFFFIPNITKPLTGHTTELVVMIVIYVGTQLLSSYVSSFNIQDKFDNSFAIPRSHLPCVSRRQPYGRAGAATKSGFPAGG